MDQRNEDSRQVERDWMVDTQILRGGITDQRVVAAMRRVPRHHFIPDYESADAYGDFPLPIGHSQTISQPFIVAYMTEALKLQPGEKVLEIGTGSGYQAAILAELGVKVFTIEIVKPFATVRHSAEKIYRSWVTTMSVCVREMATRVGQKNAPSMPLSSPPRLIIFPHRF